MSEVYIISDHGKLSRINSTLEFTAADGTIRKIFPHKLDSLIIGGIVSITGGAMQVLMKHQINTLFISSNGKYNGKLVFTGTKNVLLRKKQYALSDNADAALGIAKSIVAAKIKNEATFVQRINRNKERDADFDKTVLSLKQTLEKVETAQTLDELRGYEGSAAKQYFSVFRYNLIPEWAQFPRRSMNPPETNVNAALSFLYTLLMYRTEIAIEITGLDAMAGFLHASEYGKNALVFDLMEEFRTPVVDTLCCTLFNRSVLSSRDFQSLKEESEDGETSSAYPKYTEKGILLTKEGLKKVIPAFEKKIETLLYYPALEKTVSLNTIIIEQAAHFKRVLLGEEKVYKGYIYK